MARRRTHAPGHSEITDKVQQHETDMKEKTDDLEETAEDVETERETIDGMELAGTAEGAEAIEQSIEAARDASVQEFNSESQELDQIQDASQEHEQELHERSDTTSSDLGKVSDASGRIHSDSANRELIAAKEAAVRDIEFLDGEAKRSEEAREESRRLLEQQRSRVDAARGA